jgi:hypothetical protein
MVGNASVRRNIMEIAHQNARQELFAYLIKRFGIEQARQFVFNLSEQGLSDGEITCCLQEITKEIAISRERL